MKKGLSYVDWSISIGLFIVYIITIFILLGPAFKQDYSTEYLNTIVQNGIEENISLELKRFPVFLRLDTIIPNNYQIGLNNIPEGIEGIDVEKIGFYTEDHSLEIISKKTYSNQPTVEIDIDYNLIGAIPIGPELSSAKLWLYLSTEKIFDFDHTPTGTALTSNNAFGVAETIKGIYEPRFRLFSQNDYNTAKELINYPNQKDFAIEIYNETKINETPILNYTKASPTEKDEVNVLLWANWLIHNDTKRTPITILIKTW